MSVFNAYAQFYDLLYRDKDYAQEARFVNECLVQKGGSIADLLELGCGTGRHAVQFSALGHSVTGVDMSPEMVEQAKNRAAQLPPERQAGLRFQTGDVRSLELGCRFDSVVSLFHVMNYQVKNEDLKAAFSTAARHLKPGGLFLFDFWYGPAVLRDPPVVRIKHLQDETLEATRIAEPELHPNENLVIVNYHLFLRNRYNQEVTEVRVAHPMRYLFKPELDSLLERAGFESGTFGGWLSTTPLGFNTWFGWCCARLKP